MGQESSPTRRADNHLSPSPHSLSRAIGELEPTLTRNGYDAPALTVLLKAKPGEVRNFLAGPLPNDRTREFTGQLRMAGVPV